MITKDITYIKGVLPQHYEVKESKKAGSIHCKSRTGLRSGVDSDDAEHWFYVKKSFQSYFGEKLQEVYFNTNAYYQDFTIYIKQ